MFREEDEQMQSLGLAPQTQITQTPQLGQQPIQAASASAPATQPTTDMLMAQATPTDLKGMTFSAEELGLGDQDPAPISDPEPVREQPSTPSLTFSSEDLGIEEPTEEEPTMDLFSVDDEGEPLPDRIPEFFGVDDAGEPLPAPVSEEESPPEEIDIAPTEFFQFSTDIYRGRTPEENQKIYQQFLDNENTVSVADIGLWQTNPETGERTFVFRPLDVTDPFGIIDVNTRIAASFVNAFGDVLELTGSILDLVPGQEGHAQAARSAIPTINTGQSGMDALLYEGVPIFAAGYLAAARTAALLRGNVPEVSRGLLTFLAGETAATAVSPTDSGTIFIGEQAMIPVTETFPLLKGLDLASEDAEDVLRRRLTLLFDGAVGGRIIGPPLIGAANAGVFGYKFLVEPVWTAVRPSTAGIERQVSLQVVDQIAKPILDSLSSINRSNMNNPEALYRVRLTIANAAEENSRVITSSIRDVNQQLDLAFDTATSIIRGIPESQAAPIRMRLEQYRSGMLQTSQLRTTDAVNLPTRRFQEEISGRLEDVGGATPTQRVGTMRESAEGFADLGRAEIRQDLQTVQELRQAFDTRAQDLISDLARSGDLASEVNRLSRSIGTEVPITRDTSLERIEKLVKSAYSSMRTTKNDLYSQIDRGPVDIGAIYDALRNAPVDILSNQGQLILGSEPARRTASLLQPRMIDAPPSVGGQQLAPPGISAPSGQRLETREEVIARVQSVFDQEPNKYNFGLFYNVIRPELSAAASSLSQTSPGASRAIRDIIRVIDDDLVEYVARQGDPDLARAAREAKEYYVKEFAPIWRSGRLQDYSDLYDSTIGRTREGQELFRADDFFPEARSLLRRTIQEGDMDRIGQLRRLLERPEAGGTAEPLSTFIVADTLLGAASELRRTAGTGADLETFVRGLERYSSSLRANFKQTADELDQFARDINALQGDRVALARRLEEAEKALDTTARTIATGELRFFFRDNFRDSADALLREASTISDPIPAFRRLITSDPASTQARLTDIMNRIDSAPAEQREVLFKGLETAYVTQLNNRLFGGTLESGGIRNLLSRNINNNLEEVETLYAAGDVIYRNTPEVMDSVRFISDVAAGTNLSRNARPIAAMSPTEFNRMATTATNQFIYATIGPLTRAGTRIRAFTGAVIQRNSPDERAAEILDRIFADPVYFAQLVRRYNEAPSDPLLQQMMIDTLLPSVVRPTETGVTGLAETELMLRDGLGRTMESIDEQTERLFGTPRN